MPYLTNENLVFNSKSAGLIALRNNTKLLSESLFCKKLDQFTIAVNVPKLMKFSASFGCTTTATVFYYLL